MGVRRMKTEKIFLVKNLHEHLTKGEDLFFCCELTKEEIELLILEVDTKKRLNNLLRLIELRKRHQKSIKKMLINFSQRH